MMKWPALLLVGLWSTSILLHLPRSARSAAVLPPFRNDSLPWDERVDDLVARLSLDEMAGQMARGGSDQGPRDRNGPAPPIARLGIGAFAWDDECLHGDEVANATSFPQSIGLSATFSTDLLYRVAEAIGSEVRARYNNLTQHNITQSMGGLSCFSPVINIMRHPLWGRNQETYGEDPFLSGEMARAYVTGLQGSHPRYVRANAGCKHFAVYAGPENIPTSRLSFDAKVSDRDLYMTFLPQFHACVKAGSYNIMCSYNSINGVPACGNRRFLRDILRDQLGFRGYVISDESALEFMMSRHRYTATALETAGVAIRAGVSLELSPRPDNVYSHVAEAVLAGLASRDEVAGLVRPLFYTRMRLGEFDPPGRNPYTQLRADVVVGSAQHRALALEAALKSFVLLKNDGVLPLAKIRNLAVVGPFANDSRQIFGDYSGQPPAQYISTPWQGLEPLSDAARFAAGCDNPQCTKYNQSSVLTAVGNADIVVVCLGSGISIESESRDRKDLKLPGNQLQLLQDAVQAAKGKPVVLLLFTASPFDISWAVDSPNVRTIVQCFLPGQATGVAIRRMFTNYKGANPAGRLPYTWPASMDQVPPMTDYSMANRTYRYFSGVPLFRFGYGLSYTAFEYSKLVVTPDRIMPCEDVSIYVLVSNTGKLDGDEVVQAYIQWLDATVTTPTLQMAAFRRVATTAGQSATITLSVPARVRAVFTDRLVLQPGRFLVSVGGRQPGKSPGLGEAGRTADVQQGSFRVDGPDTDLARCTA